VTLTPLSGGWSMRQTATTVHLRYIVSWVAPECGSRHSLDSPEWPRRSANIEKALAHVADVEAGIDAGDDLNGAAELLWACYMVLDTARSPRAHEVLIRAHSVLTERAKLLDEADRTTFLGNVPSHRAIMTAWAALSSKAT